MDKRVKLTDEQVAEIRVLFAVGDTGEAIARRFGISLTHAFAIKNGQKRTVKSQYSNVSKAFAWLLKGYAVRRDCWEDGEYLRYDRQSRLFVMTSCGESYDFELFELSGLDMAINDWELVQ